MTWEELADAISICQNCSLCKGRTNTVLGEGNRKSPLMFVGEGPGEQEDLSGRPFVGAAGQYLDRMLASIGIKREAVYICNVVKCRPPENRTPTREEQEKCRIYLDAQFELVNPQVIVCLGSTPARALIHPDIRITKARGMWHLKRGIYIMPTYHPAAILYDPTKEQASLYDISVVREKLRELRIYDQLSMGTEGNA